MMQRQEKASALHAQLSDVMREKILKNEWKLGSKIPSEATLTQTYHLSRGTVRKAIGTLVNEGLLRQVHGSGTYVSEPGISHPAGVRPLSFAESLRNQGKEFTTQVVTKFVDVPPASVGDRLHLRAGDEALYLRRVRSVDSEPVMCQEGWFNLRECPGLDQMDFTYTSAFNAVEETSQRKIVYSEIRYMARVAGVEHAQYLNCDEHAPVLLLRQLIKLEDGAPIEWNHTWLKAGQEVVGTAIQN